MEFLSKFTSDRKLSAVLLFLVSFAIYSPSLRNDFVWDDVEVVTKNYISFDAAGIVHTIVPEVNKNKKARYYRPMLYTSLVIDEDLWGTNSFGFHLSNLIYNSASVVVFYFMVILIMGGIRVEGKEITAFLSSILFALYPMHVESVSWVAGRTDVLCALFLFFAFIFHILSSRNLWLLVLASLGFSIALLSKEVAVVFPFLVLVFDLLTRRGANRVNILRYGVYILILLVYFYLRGRAFVNIPDAAGLVLNDVGGLAPVGGEHVSSVSRCLEIVYILMGSYLFYLTKLIFPFGFNAFITNVPKQAPYLISAMIVLSALTLLVIISARKKENVTAFGILWVLISLGPSALVAAFSIASTPLAERYLYIPSSGFCFLIGYWVIEAGSRVRLKGIVWRASILLIATYAFAAYERQGVWRDNLSLWRDTSLKSPDHPLPHTNYGLALSDTGKRDEAVKEFAIALSPELNDTARGKAVTANDLALVYLDEEEYPRAEMWLRKALEYDPGYGKTYYHLGLIYFIKGSLTNSAESYKKSERYLRMALEHYYSYGKANLLLAKIYMRRGETDKAKKEAGTAVKSGLPKELLKEADDILEIDNAGGDKEPH